MRKIFTSRVLTPLAQKSPGFNPGMNPGVLTGGRRSRLKPNMCCVPAKQSFAGKREEPRTRGRGAPHTLSLIMIMLYCLCGYSFAADSSLRPKRILLVHSYYSDYPWVQEITSGVNAALKGKNVVLEIFYMDTKRKTSDEWKVKAGEAARARIAEWKPDAVITADDNAQIFVAQNYRDKSPYFVFCGVNAEPSDYGFPASNITGVIERPDFMSAVNLLKEIVKNIDTVALISDTCPTSLGAVDYMRRHGIGVKVVGYNLIDDFSLWQKRVRQYNSSASALCVYMYHTVKSSSQDKESMVPRKVMEWTVNNSNIPTVGLFDFAIEDGLLCGVVESGYEHGYEAAKIAWGLVNGSPISSFPVRKANKGSRMVNLKTASRLGISIPQDLLDTMERVVK